MKLAAGNLETITISLSPQFSWLYEEEGAEMKLDERSVEAYYAATAGSMRSLLKTAVIDPFEELLKKDSGYDNDNRPDAKVEHELKLGDIIFKITTEPRMKKPGYKEVIDGFKDFLDKVKGYRELFLEFDEVDAQTGQVTKRTRLGNMEGIVTIDGEPYISLDLVLGEVDKLKESVLVPEVKQTIGYEPEIEYRGALVIPVRQAIVLNETGALTYARANSYDNFLAKQVVSPFEKRVKAESGYSTKNLPEETAQYWFQIGENHKFCVQSIPTENPDYKGILDILTLDKAMKTKHKRGELIRIRDNIDVSDELREAYKPVQHPVAGTVKTYISLNGLSQQFDKHFQENTKPGLRQPLHHYPL
ncbi:MAG: hypothetical protein ABIG89_01565 [Candidatus Woesearchaeota archaeon]